MATPSFILVLLMSSVMFTEAGILPSLPSLPSISFPSLPSISLPSLPSLPNPFDGARGWYLPDFGSIMKFWTELPGRATNFITKLVPQPIKNLLNFDPAPNWVPDPEEFEDSDSDNETVTVDNSQLNFTDLSGQSSENRAARSRSFDTGNNSTTFDDEDEEEKNFIPHEERGNLHGIGREVIRSITNTFGNITTGLDTDSNFFTGFLNEFKDKVKAIYPGTQWCGDGNIARTKKHLGFFRKTDNCCRQHDNCPDFIEKDEMKFDLYNKGLFTRSHCDCDRRFYDCLKASNDMISNQIGTAYFTVLGPQCFKKEYPILYCRIQVGLTNRCIEYELDNSTQKIYQWFDNPEY